MTTAKNVLITGASGGIGAPLAKALSEAGWTVFAGVRSPDAGVALEAAGANINAVELDITDEASVAHAARVVAGAVDGRGLGGLVNNAGIIIQGPLELVPLHALRRELEVNVIGQMAVTQAVLPLLRPARGTIVNIGAPTGLVAMPMLGPLSASKAAFESLSDALRMELRHQGVNVSVVVPGALQTEIFDRAARAAAADGFAGDAATQRRYAPAMEAAAKALAATELRPVDDVVRTVVDALTARRPARRYVVGRDARQVLMLRRVPEGLRERLVMNALGLRPTLFAQS